MLCKNAWQSSAAMLHFGTAMLFSYPLMRTVMHGSPVHHRCRLHYAEGASTHSWMPKILHIPFQTEEFGMCGNFDPSHLMKRVSHMLGGGGCPYFAGGVVFCCAA